ncbi:MAG: hypothetical protein AB7I18_07940, partial [Candidatus Berkiella sp.]
FLVDKLFAQLSDHKIPRTSSHLFEFIQYSKKTYGDSSVLDPFHSLSNSEAPAPESGQIKRQFNVGVEQFTPAIP